MIEVSVWLFLVLALFAGMGLMCVVVSALAVLISAHRRAFQKPGR